MCSVQNNNDNKKTTYCVQTRIKTKDKIIFQTVLFYDPRELNN